MTDKIQEEIEDKIIDLITLGGGSRLVVFKPENSDKDLMVEKRGDYKKKKISLNIYNGEFSDAGDFKKIISQLVVRPEENFYLVFVRFNIVKQDIEDNFWIVPSLSFKEDDFSEFLTNKNNFVGFLIDELT